MIVGHVAVRVAVAGAALFPVLVFKSPAEIVLVNVPAAAAVTSTVMVQDPEGIVLPFARVTVVPPATALAGPPPQVVATLGTAATRTIPGKVSVNKAFRLMSAALGLFNVMVSVETPPGAILTGLNAFATVGGVGGLHPAKVNDAGPVTVASAVAKARPSQLPLVMLTAAPERMVPLNVASVIVAPAEVFQYELHACAVPLMTTDAPVSVRAPAPPVPTLKIHTSLAVPASVRVTPAPIVVPAMEQ